jgi:hypothetical protein
MAASTVARRSFSKLICFNKKALRRYPSTGSGFTSECEGGAGGSRTRVQTWKSYAFYMLISA